MRVATLFCVVWFSVPASFADYDRALESYLKEDYLQASKKFDRVISESPSHPRLALAVYYSALCRLNLDQPRQAVDRLQMLLAENPDSASSPSPAMVRLALGIAFKMLGDDTSALSYFESSWLRAANAFERAAAREKIKDIRVAPAPVVDKQPAPDAAKVAPPIPAKVHAAWVVQVASAPDRSQADAILDRLRRDGWPAYAESTDIKGSTHHRVRVGPYPSESRALDAKGRLQTEFGLEGWVTRK